MLLHFYALFLSYKTDIDQKTFRSVWKGLPTWRKAGKAGFPLYRVTNDTFMDEVRPDGNFFFYMIYIVINIIHGDYCDCDLLSKAL